MSMSSEEFVMNLEDVLQAWNLEEYAPNFREHCIDLDEWECLLDPSNERMLHAIVPVFGHAMRLKNNIKALLEQSKNIVDNTGTLSKSSTQAVTLTDSGLGTGVNEALKEKDPVQSSSTNTESQSVAGSSDNINLNNTTKEKQSKAVSKRPREADEITTNNLLHVLRKSGHGRGLLAKARSSTRLTETDRNKISELVIDAALSKESCYKLTTSDFENLVKEILEIFPDEKEAIYYIPYKKVGNTKCAAKGKLIQKYQSIRKYLRASGEITNANDGNNDDDDNDHEQGVEALEEKLQYLRQNLDDWPTITEYWKDTSKFRIHNLRNTPHLLSRSKKPRKGEEAAASTVAGYIALFPCLKDAQGYHLFISDFDLEYPGYKNAIFSGWNNFISKAHNALKAIEKPCDALKDSLALLEDDVHEQETNDLIVLLSLAYLDTVVTVTRVQKDKKYTTWRPAHSEIQEGLFSLVETNARLETFIINRFEKFEKWKLPVAPFCVAVGTSVDDVSRFFVVLDKTTRFDFNNAQRALDVCFKILHASFARYSDEAHRLWMLVQLELYHLKTMYDNTKEDAQLPKLLAKFE